MLLRSIAGGTRRRRRRARCHRRGCKIDHRDLRLGDSGTAVTCLQQALVASGYLSGSATGQFDNATFSAVNKLQKEKDLFVDGLVGRETALPSASGPTRIARGPHAAAAHPVPSI